MSDEIGFNENEIKNMIYRAKEKEIESLMKVYLDEIKTLEQAALKQHSFPLSRIKKIMKADEDVKLITKEVLPLMVKSCEFFIQELVYNSWVHTEEDRRVTLNRADLLCFINRTEILDFLSLIFGENK